MGQVTVTINGRTYRLACGEGEEARVAELAGLVSQRMDRLVAEVGNASQDLLLLMVSLLLADELTERAATVAKPAAAAKTAAAAKPASPKPAAETAAKPAQPKGEADAVKAAGDPSARATHAAGGA